ncbi:hypothetical protein PG999_007888 [Apiospora kogelbergensis]|uniref:Uncharacterized protein n=1 Tax=Apiospora kogelbergensis TaxID=1337665 RepID=A0AAW0QUF0_9PEZI
MNHGLRFGVPAQEPARGAYVLQVDDDNGLDGHDGLGLEEEVQAVRQLPYLALLSISHVLLRAGDAVLYDGAWGDVEVLVGVARRVPV